METSESTFAATEPPEFATSSILSYWYVFLVLLVVLAISMVFFCTCLVKRKRRHGQQSLTGTNTPVEQRNVALHSVKTSVQNSNSSVLDYRGNASPGSFSLGHTPVPSPQPSFSSSHRSGQSGIRYSSSLAGGQKRRKRNHSPAHTSSGSEDTIRGIQGHSLSSLTSSVATLEPQCSRLHRAESTSSSQASRATLSRCGSRNFGHRRSTSNPSVKITALTPESPLHSAPSLLSVESGHTHKSTSSAISRRSSIDSSNRVHIDVKVHLDQNKEMAPSQIAAALAESARQLAQSAANFEHEDDGRSTWSRSHMSSPRPSLSVLSAPHVPYQGKSRRQLFANNSYMDHHGRQDLPPTRTPLATTRSVHATSMDRLPHVISQDRSGHSVSLDRPGHTVSLDKPGLTVSLDRPARTVSLDRPGHTASLERPGHTVSLDKPGHTVSLDKPGHTVSLDRHAHAVSLDRPGHTVSLNRPGRTVSQDRPAQVSLERPTNTINLDRSGHIVTNRPAHAVSLGQTRHMQASHVNPSISANLERQQYILDSDHSLQQPASFASAELAHIVAGPKYNIHAHSGQPTMWTLRSLTNQQQRPVIAHPGLSPNSTLEQSLQHQAASPSSTKMECVIETESEVSTLKASSHQGTTASSQDLSQEASVYPEMSSTIQHGEVDRSVTSPLSSHDESSLHSRSGSGLSLEPTLGSAISGYAATGSSSSTENISKSLQNYDNTGMPPTQLFSDNATGQQTHLVHRTNQSATSMDPSRDHAPQATYRTNQSTTSMDPSRDHAPQATYMSSVRSGNVYYTTDAVPVHTRKQPLAVMPTSSTRMDGYSMYPAHDPALYEQPPRLPPEYDIPHTMDMDATAMNSAYSWTLPSRLGYAVDGPGGIVAPSAAPPVHVSMVPSGIAPDYESIPFSVTGVHGAGHRAPSVEVGGIHGPTDPPHPHDSISNFHDHIPSGSMTIDI